MFAEIIELGGQPRDQRLSPVGQCHSPGEARRCSTPGSHKLHAGQGLKLYGGRGPQHDKWKLVFWFKFWLELEHSNTHKQHCIKAKKLSVGFLHSFARLSPSLLIIWRWELSIEWVIRSKPCSLCYLLKQGLSSLSGRSWLSSLKSYLMCVKSVAGLAPIKICVWIPCVSLCSASKSCWCGFSWHWSVLVRRELWASLLPIWGHFCNRKGVKYVKGKKITGVCERCKLWALMPNFWCLSGLSLNNSAGLCFQ